MVANAKVNKNSRFKDCTRQCNHIYQNEDSKSSPQAFHQYHSKHCSLHHLCLLIWRAVCREIS